MPRLLRPAARGQDYPARPVRLITDSAPGSAIDVPVRLIAEGLSRIWGQQAVVVNQPGAGGAIAARSAATATPDGYTFGVMALSAFVALPGTADNLPVVVPRDVIPVGYLGGAPMFIGAAPWLGVKTLPDLIALAKQKSLELSYGVNAGRAHQESECRHRQSHVPAGATKACQPTDSKPGSVSATVGKFGVECATIPTFINA
jgi:tripartite-type tricarboxylate transporter receptor subunit TctC